MRRVFRLLKTSLKNIILAEAVSVEPRVKKCAQLGLSTFLSTLRMIKLCFLLMSLRDQ